MPNNYFIIQEQKVHAQQNSLLQNTGYIRLTLKLFVIAILPAVAEEIVFRGVILNRIKKATQNEHYSVIITSILFAIIHFQPSHILSMIFLETFHFLHKPKELKISSFDEKPIALNKIVAGNFLLLSIIA